jgi:hypothetical protein
MNVRQMIWRTIRSWSFSVILFLGFAHGCILTHGQESESIKDLSEQRIRKTTWSAAILPGSGQIINKKYWKAPLVWGGMVWCISAIKFNQSNLEDHRTDLIALLDADPTTKPTLNIPESTLLAGEAFYQKQRDISWLALIGVHLLGVLDAHVDAHLMNFDVSEDLSLTLYPPMSSPNFRSTPTSIGIRWSF